MVGQPSFWPIAAIDLPGSAEASFIKAPPRKSAINRVSSSAASDSSRPLVQ